MHATVLLPALALLGGAGLSAPTAHLLGRGNRLPAAAPGRQAQLRRYFDLPAGQWPLAALTRQDDCNDAGDALWLRADPCYLRPDINGARLMAVGDALVRDEHTAQALFPELKAIFAEAGFRFEIGAPGRWYLQLPEGTVLPQTLPPEDALGVDLLEYLPDGDNARRWRALLSEVEIALHHHPHNVERIAAGQWPINSLWLWGGGRFPASITTPVQQFYSRDETALALAAAAGVAALLEPLAHVWERGWGEGAGRMGRSGNRSSQTEHIAFDLTHLRSLAELDCHWLQPLLTRLKTGSISYLRLDTEDGHQYELRRTDRWRVWRKPWTPPT